MKRTKFRLKKNTTDISSHEVKRIVRFILDHLGTFHQFDVILTNSHTGWVGGHAGVSHGYVLLRVPFRHRLRYRPYQYAHLKSKAYWLLNKLEILVVLAAHEIRHLWQRAFPKAGRHPNSRGKYSEVDTEGFAIHILRAWRKACGV